MSDITVKELEELGKKLRVLDDEKKEIEDLLSDKNKEIRDVKTQLQATLEALEMQSFKCKAGTIIRSERWSWKVPKEPNAKQKFFDYLRERDVYDQLITVNSQTLNKYCKEEMKAAVEEGRELKIPGIDEPTVSYTISLRKG